MEDNSPDGSTELREQIVQLKEELERKNKQLADLEELILEMEQKLDGTTKELSDVLDILKSMRHRVQEFEQEYSDDSDYGGVDISPLEDLNNKDRN